MSPENSVNIRAGQVAIVTGGSQGIGLATVAALAAMGMAVVAAARDSARLDDALAALSGDVTGIAADVSREEDVKALLAAAVERFGRIDVLVNCAGVSMSAKRGLLETDTAEWRRIIETNLTGTYFMCREALPFLMKSSDAYIFNMQSTAAYVADPGISVYAASKFGVRALTEALTEECRGSGIRVTSVSPGAIDTSIWSHKLEPPSAERRARMLKPSDIADTFVWLLSRPKHVHIPNITITSWNRV